VTAGAIARPLQRTVSRTRTQCCLRHERRSNPGADREPADVSCSSLASVRGRRRRRPLSRAEAAMTRAGGGPRMTLRSGKRDHRTRWKAAPGSTSSGTALAGRPRRPAARRVRPRLCAHLLGRGEQGVVHVDVAAHGVGARDRWIFSSSCPPCRWRSAAPVEWFGERRAGGAADPPAASIAGPGWCARRAGGCEPRVSEDGPAWSCV